ncbi:MAG: TetR/AcrR family transcriptional regulator [Opitutaceae bacterium]
MKNVEKKDAVLMTANRLFESQGFHATGVDQLAAESGVTKRTIYKYFGSKEGLIEEVLRRHHEGMMSLSRAKVMAVHPVGDARLMACIELYRDWFARSNFSGCIFVKTLNEFGGCSQKLSRIAIESKRAMHAFIVELAVDLGAQNPELLADQLQILLEGSVIVAQAGAAPDIVDIVKEMAKVHISAACN